MTLMDILNEQHYYDYNNQFKHLPQQIDLFTNNPINKGTVDINNKENKEIGILNNERNIEINKISEIYNKKIIEIRKIYSKQREKRIEKSFSEVADFLIEKLEGKVLFFREYENMSPEEYYYGGGNYKFVIGKLADLKISLKKTNVQRNEYYGYYSNTNYNNVWASIELDNGKKIEGYVSYLQIKMLDNTIRYLKKNKGRHFTFYGSLIDSINNYIKKRPRTKTINTIFYKNRKQHEVTLEDVGIINIPKIGDFLTINNKYIFDTEVNFNVSFKRIDAVDPYGEEDWSDEMPWED